MRRLYIIPIIHTPADLGRLSSGLEQWKRTLVPFARIEAAKVSVAKFWTELHSAIQSWQLDFRKLRIYQDALPVCGEQGGDMEHRIVKDLSARGSANHQLLQWMIDEGATLTGTESPELLLEEYTLVRQRLHGEELAVEKLSEQNRQLSDLLERRDRFIANRIHATLEPDQLGIVFLGLLHRLPTYLPSDIYIDHPFGNPTEFEVADLEPEKQSLNLET